MKYSVCAIFFLSGASALAFETLWFHQAGIALGNSVWASSLVLAGFMAGLAAGNGLAARWGDAVVHPLRWFALAEVGIAAAGVSIVVALPGLGRALAPWLGGLETHWVLQFARLSLAFFLLLVPTTAMGASLPLLTRVLAERHGFGAALGGLYGWNTAGAVAGVVAAEAWGVGALGIRGTALAAGSLNLVVAVSAAWLSWSRPRPGSAAPAPAPAPAPGASVWLAAVFTSGFAMLALEVVWLRFLALFVESTSLAFALILAVVLCGIATGGIAGSSLLRWRADAWRGTSAIAKAAGVLVLLGYAAFPLLHAPFASLSSAAPLRAIGLALPLMLPVAFASGLLFTLAGAALRASFAAAAATTGRLTLANTVGAALGSLVGGFVLLPALGTENSLFVLAILYAGVGALLLGRCVRSRGAAWGPGLAFALCAAVFPFGAMERSHLALPVRAMSDAGDEIVAVREGLLETLVYVVHRELGRPASYRMITNCYSMSGNKWSARRYMDLYVSWPLAVHPRLERALLISFGVGNTAKALTRSPELVSIDVVDISPEVLEMSELLFDEGANPLSDPRVRTHVEDGRQFLQTTSQRYDLVTGEPPPPQMAGVVNLYTREYFALLRDRLAEGGIATYWLPLHTLSERAARSVLRGFCDVFRDCSLWHGSGRDLMMVGTRNAAGPVSAERFTRQWSHPEMAAELRAIGLERPEQLGALFIGGPDFVRSLVGDAPPLVDDRPKRILAPGSAEAETRFARLVHDTDGARDRFLESPLVARLWPDELRRGTAAYFDAQYVAQRVLLNAPPVTGSRIADADWLLATTPLRTPVEWLLGSDADRQRIVARADAVARAHPRYQLHIGIRHLAERRPQAALAAFERAEAAPELLPRARPLRLYTLGLLGRRDEARRLAGSREGLRVEPGFWRFLEQRFGIRPAARLARSAEDSARP